ncbi:uncharacterized protein BDZ99DRAFT_495192 [Mytilinidion resinicola]|uniref:Uncharacterized protein n=1 Tax=Mytilinidion resinicola TaxID=574789 RepID=A0A6A6Z2N9_9PEZI|nr:uncharacterized protein BDZ99DRAFT_495192 [Mytilinidion resinicola]KAF2815432.1 hypothetical protein BDZ99DRAFT_495192 [Mytilinidion resinicola]
MFRLYWIVWEKDRPPTVKAPKGLGKLPEHITEEDIVRESYWHYKRMKFNQASLEGNNSWSQETYDALTDEESPGITAGFMFNIPIAMSRKGQLLVDSGKGKKQNFPCRTGFIDVNDRYKSVNPGEDEDNTDPEESTRFIQATGLFTHGGFWKHCTKRQKCQKAEYERPAFVDQAGKVWKKSDPEYERCAVL